MGDDERREAAIQRLKDKRDFTTHIVSYVLINGLLVLIWAITGAGYFWPIWVIAGWGVGLVLHAWTVFGQRPITEDEIEREMRRGDDEGPTSA